MQIWVSSAHTPIFSSNLVTSTALATPTSRVTVYVCVVQRLCARPSPHIDVCVCIWYACIYYMYVCIYIHVYMSSGSAITLFVLYTCI